MLENSFNIDEEKKKIKYFLNSFFSSKVNTTGFTTSQKKRFANSFMKAFSNSNNYAWEEINKIKHSKFKSLSSSIDIRNNNERKERNKQIINNEDLKWETSNSNIKEDQLKDRTTNYYNFIAKGWK